jgi:hypothetical protein
MATSRATAAAEDGLGLGLVNAAEDPGQANVGVIEVATEVVIATPAPALALLLVTAAGEATTTVAEIPVTIAVLKDATARAVLFRTGATPRTTDLIAIAAVNHHARLAALTVSMLILKIP